jgi:transcription initiation factor TFIIIB Brf1 subunit/transcription initiation factor TFIIB
MSHSSSPNISAIERPRCPKCKSRMGIVGVGDGSSKDFEERTCYCAECGHVEKQQIAKDPIKAAAGWLASELRPPR